MSDIKDYISKEHFPIIRNIDQEIFEKMKSSMPEDEFNKKYYSKKDKGAGVTYYYERIFYPESQEDAKMLLLSELLKLQTEATKKLGTIAGIIITFFVLSILAAIIALVTIL